MSRRRALGGALVLLLVAAPAPGAHAANDVTATDDTITITVKVDFAGASPSLARRWGRAFERFFNDGPGLGGFDYCGREVEFVADVRAVPPGEPRTDAHLVYVEDARSGVDLISFVDWGEDYDPTQHNAAGHWEADLDDATVAHEFGHLLALDDQYFADLGPDGERDLDDPTTALPNHEGELMGDNGEVTQAYIDQVASAHADARGLELGCERWEGSFIGEGRNVPPGGCEPAALYDYGFTITVQPDGAATLVADGVTSSSCSLDATNNEITIEGGKAGSRFTFPGPFPGPFTLRIATGSASGTGSGMVGRLHWTVDITARCVDCG